MNAPSWKWAAVWSALWLAALVPFIVTPLDIDISAAIYYAGGGTWDIGKLPVWMFFYRVGVFPAVVLGLVSLIVYVFSFDLLALHRYRKVAGYFLANLALGPLLLVNGVFKGMCGRPRPVQVYEFGGTMPFEKLFHLNFETFGKSMASGHASMGFVFFALVFLVHGRRCKIGAGIFALLFGGLIGAARVAQGGHFASDVLLAGAVCWAIAWGLAKLFHLHQGIWMEVPAYPDPGRRVRSLRRLGMTGAIFLAIACFVGLATPRDKSYNTQLTPSQGSLALELEGTLYLTGRSGSNTRLRSELNGFGSPKSRMNIQASDGMARHHFIGIFSEKNISSWLEIPRKNNALSEIRLSPRIALVVVRDDFDLAFPVRVLHSANTEVRLEFDNPLLVFVTEPNE